MRRHGVSWHYPAAFAELVGNGELVEVVLVFRIEAESDERKTIATTLAIMELV